MRKHESLFLAFWVVRIREFRTKMNLSQEKLAEKLHVNTRNYQKLEWGVHKPSCFRKSKTSYTATDVFANRKILSICTAVYHVLWDVFCQFLLRFLYFYCIIDKKEATAITVAASCYG